MTKQVISEKVMKTLVAHIQLSRGRKLDDYDDYIDAKVKLVLPLMGFTETSSIISPDNWP